MQNNTTNTNSATSIPTLAAAHKATTQMPLRFVETYKTAAASTGNISSLDAKILHHMSKEENSMIASRPTGFFFKLYVEPELNQYEQLSTELNNLLLDAAKQGFRCIEFDEAAEHVDGAVVFDW